MVFCSQGEHCREGSGSGYQGEDDGDDGGRASGAAVFEDLDIEYHLAGQDKDDDRAGHGEGLDVHSEEGEDGVSQKEEEEEDYRGQDGSLTGLYLKPFVLESDDDRGGACDVYHREEHHEGAEYFLDAEMKFHAAKVRKLTKVWKIIAIFEPVNNYKQKI